MDDDQKYYAFVPTYGDVSTAFQRHMISVVVFSSSEKLQSMLVGYAVIEMVCFDDSLYAAPHSKTMRGDCITLFLLHIYRFIIVNKTRFVTETLVAKDWLNSLYSRLGFKVIKDFVIYPNLEEACEQFHYESGKERKWRNKKLAYNVIKLSHNVLQLFITI